jgi:hypothetical protein
MIRLLAAAACAVLTPCLAAQEPLSCAQARQLVLPGADELAAETIAWRTSFRAGALEADRLDRPILLWAMNGHPLGCT